jgi:hypothetical protein
VSQTLGVTLSSDGRASGVNVVLTPSTGQIKGIVTGSATGARLAGVTVTITDGLREQQTITASLPAGGYELAQVPAGTYTVTYSLAGYSDQTELVVMQAGLSVTENIKLGALNPGTGAATPAATTTLPSTSSATAGAGTSG